MRFWLGLFFAGAALEVLVGAKFWPGIFAGNLDDPDSYMRLERIFQGVQAGHLVNAVARDDSGAGVMVEWSRLLDALIWLLALPLAPFFGWKAALFTAGVALGPIGIGAFSAALAFAAEPFTARRFLWLAPIGVALLPALVNYGSPGFVTHHIVLLALTALTAGLIPCAWNGDAGYGFLAGAAGGFAIWLTPETMPFVLLAFGALVLRWCAAPIGKCVAACGAGFFGMLAFGFAVDPPAGGYGVVEIDRLSIVFVVLGLAVLLAGIVLWRVERGLWARHRRPLGISMAALLLVLWMALFPKILLGPYGLLNPTDAKLFFGNIQEMQPLPARLMFGFLWPGILALVLTLIMGLRKGHWGWWYFLFCLALSFVLGVKFSRFAPMASAAAVVVVMIALNDVSATFFNRPARAALLRMALLGALLLMPFLPVLAHTANPAPSAPVASCELRPFTPVLDLAKGRIVLADVNMTPELLWRTDVVTVGSLYHHGIAGFLRLRMAWRSMTGMAEPDAVAATGANYVLFCSGAGRSAMVAGLPKTTLWDALLANRPPGWLRLIAEDKTTGWRLYGINHIVQSAKSSKI